MEMGIIKNEVIKMAKKISRRKRRLSRWPYYGIFQTKRNQMWVARTPEMLERALRLGWKKW